MFTFFVFLRSFASTCSKILFDLLVALWIKHLWLLQHAVDCVDLRGALCFLHGGSSLGGLLCVVGRRGISICKTVDGIHFVPFRGARFLSWAAGVARLDDVGIFVSRVTVAGRRPSRASRLTWWQRPQRLALYRANSRCL